MSKFCEAWNKCCFYFSARLIKSFLAKFVSLRYYLKFSLSVFLRKIGRLSFNLLCFIEVFLIQKRIPPSMIMRDISSHFKYNVCAG